MSDNNIRIKIFPALNGDSILLELSNNLFLIDGGYINTFNEYLFDELKGKSEEGKRISHLIVTHIDSDHISGIIRLLEKNTNSEIINIENIWHNSYRHIKDLSDNLSLKDFDGKTDLTALSGKSYLKEVIEGRHEISAEQGSALSALILKGKYKWNSEFADKAVSIDNLDTITVDDKTRIRILSPNNQKLSKLKRLWNKELYKKGYDVSEDDSNYDDAFEFLMAQEKEKKVLVKKDISVGDIDIDELSNLEILEDTSVTNGSSISFVIETDNKKLLFLADAHPSVILESLKMHYSGEEFPIEFDIIKLSHHGSITNTSKELLEVIDSKNYVISSDGSKFGHPDIETIARIINRKSAFTRNLHFNYLPKFIHEINDENLKEKYLFEIYVAKEKSPIEIEL
ncbi:AVAST type 1 anti-phage system MBL fold metallo-hydrolase Avs1a [Ancylomarina longa]|uniref:MBL fold metallo-hydrolase n=1 Tax=Ancylomarina longa TaxID=2487017 RepID=A0A434AEU3_9BACT|nr:AVAST type 1 anti-phage system MBL fold metallo-hydrolase Avs1a [Ancylomarina longa]RUT72858.1 MBL fold metallo-hydrolase [Ancylomarina longa]